MGRKDPVQINKDQHIFLICCPGADFALAALVVYAPSSGVA